MAWTSEPPTSPPDEPLDYCRECLQPREGCTCPLTYCDECGALLPGDASGDTCDNCRRRGLVSHEMTEAERVMEQDRARRALERLTAVINGKWEAK